MVLFVRCPNTVQAACPQGKYMDTLRHTEQDCKTTNKCGPGQYMVDDAWPTVDRQCGNCEDGKYMDILEHTARQCKTWTDCADLGLEEDTPPTRMLARVCAAAPAASSRYSRLHPPN